MSYNSTNTHILTTTMQTGGNRRMLLMHVCDSGRHEFVIGSYFAEKLVEDMDGKKFWEYSWDWGHYFGDVIAAVDYWHDEVAMRQ